MSLRRKHPSRWKQMKYSFAIVSLLQLFGTIKTPAPFLDWIPILGTYANSKDPVQMPQDAASDQGLYCLLKAFLCKIQQKYKYSPETPKLQMDSSK